MAASRRNAILGTITGVIVIGHHAYKGDLNEVHLWAALIAWPMLVFGIYPLMDRYIAPILNKYTGGKS